MAVAHRVLSIRKLSDLRSDEALVKAAQAGKRDALGALIERHYPRVLSFLSYLTGSRPQAEDLTQETFTRALGALGRFNGRYRFEPWLLRIAKNLVIDESRRSTHRASPVDPLDLPDLEPASDVDNVWESMSSISSGSVVTAALAKMPMRQRTILILREIEGLSYSEIAEIVGTNDRGVEATLRRARARFKMEALAAEGLEGSRAVCKRTLRLVATEGSSIEATRHLARCDECKTKSAKVRSADKALGLLPPVALGKPGWIEALTAPYRPARASGGSGRNILEILRGSQAGAVSPLAHIVEMAATIVMAGSISVASVAGNVKKVTTTSAAAAPAAVYAGADDVAAFTNVSVTLDQALRDGPGGPQKVPSEAQTEGPAPEQPSSLLDLVDDGLLALNVEGMDLLAPFEVTTQGVDIAGTLDLAVSGIADLGTDIEGLTPVTDTSSGDPLDVPILPDVTSTIAPQVALPRRRPFFA